MATRYYWLKLQDGFFGSKRIKKLRKIAGGDTYTIIYLKMQLLAMKNNGVLEYTGLEDSFAEELALDLDEEPENVAVTVNYLLSCGLMETTDNKEFFIPYAVMNTGSETAAAKRVRDHRERKALQCNADVTEVKRIGNAEKEIDIEIEKEIEKELDREDITVSTDTVRQTQSVRRAVEAWNELKSYGIKGVSKISSGSKRYKSLIARINQYGIEKVLEAIENIKQSDFLQGKNKQGWVITFDWFVLPNNFPKVLDGNYTAAPNAHSVAKNPETQSQRDGADWMLKYMNRPEPKTAKDSQEIRDRADELRQKLKGE